MQNFMTIPKMSLVRSLEVKFSTYGSNKVIKGVKMEIILISYRICTICISIDWKFSSELNGVHLEVIRGHQRGQTRSFWGQKSEIWPNTHEMHMNRFKILF